MPGRLYPGCSRRALRAVIVAIGLSRLSVVPAFGLEPFNKRFSAECAAAADRAFGYLPTLARKLDGDDTLARVGMAVVYPELVRYHYIRDVAETSALEFSYIVGLPSDFSIGPLQIKPSFAEGLEKALPLSYSARFPAIDSAEPQDERRARLRRLKNPEDQLDYLALFLELAAARFPGLSVGEAGAVKLAAVLYNVGIDADTAVLEAAASRAAFPYGPKYPGEQYNYADIAIGFYGRLMGSE